MYISINFFVISYFFVCHSSLLKCLDIYCCHLFFLVALWLFIFFLSKLFVDVCLIILDFLFSYYILIFSFTSAFILCCIIVHILSMDTFLFLDIFLFSVCYSYSIYFIFLWYIFFCSYFLLFHFFLFLLQSLFFCFELFLRRFFILFFHLGTFKYDVCLNLTLVLDSLYLLVLLFLVFVYWRDFCFLYYKILCHSPCLCHMLFIRSV